MQNVLFLGDYNVENFSILSIWLHHCVAILSDVRE